MVVEDDEEEEEQEEKDEAPELSHESTAASTETNTLGGGVWELDEWTADIYRVRVKVLVLVAEGWRTKQTQPEVYEGTLPQVSACERMLYFISIFLLLDSWVWHF